MQAINRREFHALATGTAAGLFAPLLVRADQPREELFKLALMTWTFRMPLMKGELKAHELPALARKELGIDTLEWSSKTFRDLSAGHHVMHEVPPPDFLRRLRQALDDEGSRIEVLGVGGPAYLGHVEEAGRLEALEFFRKWVEPAQLLGAPQIRCEVYTNVPAGENRYQRALEATVDGLQRLLTATADSGIQLLVENHHGISSNPRWLAEVVRTIDDPRLGVTADTNNFRTDLHMPYQRDFDSFPQYEDRHAGLQLLMPLARWVSAKTYAFDATGYEVSLDYTRILDIILGSGYRGYLSIEYEGGGDPLEGARQSVEMFRRLRDHLVARA